jgi:hypothetical protein
MPGAAPLAPMEDVMERACHALPRRRRWSARPQPCRKPRRCTGRRWVRQGAKPTRLPLYVAVFPTGSRQQDLAWALPWPVRARARAERSHGSDPPPRELPSAQLQERVLQCERLVIAFGNRLGSSGRPRRSKPGPPGSPGALPPPLPFPFVGGGARVQTARHTHCVFHTHARRARAGFSPTPCQGGRLRRGCELARSPPRRRCVPCSQPHGDRRRQPQPSTAIPADSAMTAYFA